MKFRIFVAAVLLLTLLSANIGCICTGGGGSFIEIMKMVPKDSTSFIFWDVEELGRDVYKKWQEWRDVENDWLESMGGITNDEVKYFCQANTTDLGVVTIVTGDFILEEIKQNLEGNDYTSTSYDGITMLTKTIDDKEVAVALYKGIIVGNSDLVKICIKIVKGEEGSLSLYDDSSIKGIASKLPGGVMTGIMRDRDEDNVGGEEFYEDLISLGISIEKKDEDKLKVKTVYEFAVSGAAKDEDTLINVKDDLAELDLETIKCKCIEPVVNPEEEFIVGAASMNVDDFSYFALAK